MPFTVTPMFPGDLYDTTDRMAANAAPAWPGSGTNSNGSAKWAQILELGWQGVLVAEDSGGVGATLAEFAAIAEAAGRHAMAMPLIARCVVAPILLAAAPANAATRALLEQVSAGQASVCPVIQSGGADSLQATQDGGGRVRLQGVLRGADLTEPASHLVFNVLAGDGAMPLLIMLPVGTLVQQARYFAGLDGRRTADIALDGVLVEPGQVLLHGGAVTAAMHNAMSTGAVMTSVQTVGALGAMIEQTIEYLSTRTQFGVALSTFQALRHRVVEMYVAYESARGLVKQVTQELSDQSASSHRDAALTKLYLATVGRTVAESAIQLHGGMGMTVEMPAARLAMHTLMCNLQYGDRFHYLDSLSAQMAADMPANALPA
ncbi:MAG: acyl-CoA dehydrogenase [Burkholderiaceae bacterium]|nr:acyl-CoA dehydrogenase [Burkholderiaceae bacterium]